jgi:aldehyde dehydrogenase (NAD+)
MEINTTIVEIDDYLEHLEERTAPQPAPVTVPAVPGSTARTVPLS